ncbi:hypothetical protein D3C80_2094350 [compost metagenome]
MMIMIIQFNALLSQFMSHSLCSRNKSQNLILIPYNIQRKHTDTQEITVKRVAVIYDFIEIMGKRFAGHTRHHRL